MKPTCCWDLDKLWKMYLNVGFILTPGCSHMDLTSLCLKGIESLFIDNLDGSLWNYSSHKQYCINPQGKLIHFLKQKQLGSSDCCSPCCCCCWGLITVATQVKYHCCCYSGVLANCRYSRVVEFCWTVYYLDDDGSFLGDIVSMYWMYLSAQASHLLESSDLCRFHTIRHCSLAV